jgi:hypothetical protein
MNEEFAMRKEHLSDAMRKAERCAAKGDWEESLYHLDEARILVSAIERDTRLQAQPA